MVGRETGGAPRDRCRGCGARQGAALRVRPVLQAGRAAGGARRRARARPQGRRDRHPPGAHGARRHGAPVRGPRAPAPGRRRAPRVRPAAGRRRCRAVHRADRPARRRPAAAAARLAGTAVERVLPGDRRDAPRRADPAPPLDAGAGRHRTRGRGVRSGGHPRGRDPDRRDRAAGGAHRPAHGPHARHRQHDPGGAGPDHPLGGARRARGAGRPGHRQDGGGAAPRRLPPVRPEGAARAQRRPRRRPVPQLPRVHRAGAAVPGRDGRRPPHARPALPGRGRRGGRPAGGRRRQGPHDDGVGAPPGGARQAGRSGRAGRRRGERGRAHRPAGAGAARHPSRAADQEAAQRREGDLRQERPRRPHLPARREGRGARQHHRRRGPADAPRGHPHVPGREGAPEHRMAAAHAREAARRPVHPAPVPRAIRSRAEPARSGPAGPAASRPIHGRRRAAARRGGRAARRDGHDRGRASAGA